MSPDEPVPPDQPVPPDRDGAARPGTDGERLLQEQFGSTERAERFYADQLIATLTPTMTDFIRSQTRLVVASADPLGRPDASVRFGERGFVAVPDAQTLCWPELRGNGVYTTLGNIVKNPAVHVMFLDAEERIGLHVRGEASIHELAEFAERYPRYAARPTEGRPPERWVVVTVVESYIHCRKHFPSTDGDPVDWGSDDPRAKGGDYFGAKDTPSPWSPGSG